MTQFMKRLPSAHGLVILTASALALLAVLLTSPRLAAQEDDLEPLRTLWRAGDYRAALGPLKDLRIQLGETANFELDYLVGTTLCKLTEYHTSGCEYLRSMERVYDLSQPQVVDGQSLEVRPTEQDCCKPEAGVKVAYAFVPPRKRNAILASIPISISIQKKKTKKTPGKTSAIPYDFTGTYEMIHDGWRGTLSLRLSDGEYIGSDGRAYRVDVRISGYHITLFIVGLGGENAEGSGGQKFDGYMMTQTKDAIAGLTWWNNSPFGFYAVKK